MKSRYVWRASFAIVLVHAIFMLDGCASSPKSSTQQYKTDEVRRVDEAHDDKSAWQFIKSTKDAAALSEFVQRFPNSTYLNTAKLRLKLIADGDIQ